MFFPSRKEYRHSHSGCDADSAHALIHTLILLVIELTAPSELLLTVSMTSYEAPLVNLWTGCWAVDVAPSPKFHDHNEGLPVEVSVKRTFPLEPDASQLKFATRGTGVGVEVAVGVAVIVAVAVGVAVVVGVVVIVVRVLVTVAVGEGVIVVVRVGVVGVADVSDGAGPIRFSFAITTFAVTSMRRTATGPAGRDAGVTPCNDAVRINPDPV